MKMNKVSPVHMKKCRGSKGKIPLILHRNH